MNPNKDDMDTSPRQLWMLDETVHELAVAMRRDLVLYGGLVRAYEAASNWDSGLEALAGPRSWSHCFWVWTIWGVSFFEGPPCLVVLRETKSNTILGGLVRQKTQF